MKREEISSKYKWDLGDIYISIDEYNKDVELLKSLTNDFINYKGKVTSSALSLRKVLELDEQIGIISTKLYVFSNMNLHIDSTNSFYQELTGSLNILMSDLSEKTAFFMPELLRASYDKIQEFISKNKKLTRFSFHLERLFNEKEHVLSLKEEELLSRCSNILNSPDKTFAMLNDADLVFKSIRDEDGIEQELTKGSYYKFLTSKNRDVRKEAFTNFYNKFKELNNTFGSIMNSNLQATNFIYKTRKYKSPLNMHLDDNRIDVSIYHDLIKQVNNNLDKVYKYFDIRKHVFKYDELHMYDLMVNLIEEENKEYNYEAAKSIILDALKVMGDNYILLLNKAFNENWIDVYETKGKHSGAYSWGCYPNHPYVLLNYQNRLDDVSTVAHELGHALNRYYSNLKQDYFYSDNEIFDAEIASTVNELLLKFYLLNKTNDKKEKLNIINELLDDVKNTIYRQTMFAEFELDIHTRTANGETLTAEKLNTIYFDLVKKYHGENLFFDEEIKYEWSRIPHFYSPFYVFQYATGLSIAFVIANKIYKGDKSMLDKYLEFLSSGSKDYPTKLVNKMGIDINVAVKEALNIFDDLMERFKKLL